MQWPEFGLNPQRSNATSRPTGITEANVGHLRRRTVSLPGTVDSSPIYLHEATVDGVKHDVIVVTTTYGKTLAIDANSGQILWTFTPPGFSSWAGTAQITNATPIADPDGQYIYAPSPNGVIYKLSLADGTEVRSGSWPAKVTLEPKHEKIGSPLNIDGNYVIAVTEGYDGDIPPYQGHVVAIERCQRADPRCLQLALRQPSHADHAVHLRCERFRHLGSRQPRSCCPEASRSWSALQRALERDHRTSATQSSS